MEALYSAPFAALRTADLRQDVTGAVYEECIACQQKRARPPPLIWINTAVPITSKLTIMQLRSSGIDIRE